MPIPQLHFFFIFQNNSEAFCGFEWKEASSFSIYRYLYTNTCTNARQNEYYIY